MLPVEFLAIGAVLFAIGIAVLFVRVGQEDLRAPSALMPGLALFRFRIYRYGVTICFFVLSAISLAHWAGFI